MTYDEMAALYASAFPNERPWRADEFEEICQGPHILKTHSTRAFILGRVTLDEAEIITICTHPDARRQGIGRTLLTQFEEECVAASALCVFLEVAADNDAAQALYTASGYAQIGCRRNYYKHLNGETRDALIFSRNL